MSKVKDMFNEIAKATPEYSGMMYERDFDKVVLPLCQKIAELTWDKCWASTGEGWNGEIQPHGFMDAVDFKNYNGNKEQFINQLFNDTP
jgi:hypothetical protein